MLRSISIILVIGMLTACSAESPRVHADFNADWTFHLGDETQAYAPDYDDSEWRTLNLPHDWSIELPFDRRSPTGTGGGALRGGVGWYRKTFELNSSDKNKQIFIDFDGVYMDSEVFLNGHSLGKRPFGYISFQYDMTPYLNFDEPNVIAVRVDNSMQPNSRWYSGSGIYRNVWLTKVNPVHVDLWGTYATTPSICDAHATVDKQTTVVNSAATDAAIELTSIIKDADGVVRTTQSTPVQVTAGGKQITKQELVITNPTRWTLDNPYLYTIHTEIKQDGKLVDTYETNIGVRYFRFDAQKGFFLNNEPIKIKGVCMHHDLGCLGTAINTRALERQLEILREMGVNGIRTSHNPPAPELLDLCDKMGFIVMDEAFDMWRKKKSLYDYSRFFNEWHVKDLTDLIVRDRNHPSVFLWSTGNEVLEQWTHADADTLTLEEANLILNAHRDASALHYEGEESGSMSFNSLLTQELSNIVRELDPTRPITAGNNESRPNNHLFRSNAIDVIGYNYQLRAYRNVPTNFPGKPFIATETTSALATRGYYKMPSDSVFIQPGNWRQASRDSILFCSSYDNNHVPWGSTHEDSWRFVKENDFVSGMYIWTGFDYIGEPTPYPWPARSSYFGIVDLAGFPKDAYYMYQSEWTDEPMVHLFPHWNWTPGDSIDMWAYYNNADEAELFINGKSQGVRSKPDDIYHVWWRVAYEPGTVKIVTRRAGQEVKTQEIHTAGEPAAIRLTPDRTQIHADGYDLSFVTVDIVDKDGNLCPNADNLVKFEVGGKAFVAGVDNGSQISMESFKASERKAFFGKCLVVLQNKDGKGGITLTATSDGLPASTVKLSAK
ncbi:MAG: DUF4982 domain-containing protein [Prevotellaceae bacterium]|nr:DUF4982 domain-containing protein [Prevotellaceae bacterium]